MFLRYSSCKSPVEVGPSPVSAKMSTSYAVVTNVVWAAMNIRL